MNDEELFLSFFALCMAIFAPIWITRMVLNYRLKKLEIEQGKQQRSPYFEPKSESLMLPEDKSLKVSELEGLIQSAVQKAVMPLQEEVQTLKQQLKNDSKDVKSEA